MRLQRIHASDWDRCGATVLLAFASLLFFGILPLRAQEPESPGATGQTIEIDPEWQVYRDHPWSAFVKGGPAFRLGGGFFDEGTKTGWTVQTGMQVRFVTLESMHFFFELGGGYASNRRAGPAAPTSGTFFAPGDDHTHSGEYYDTNVLEISRPTVHAAFGGRYFPAFLNPSESCQVHFDARCGLRAGAALFQYDATPRQELLSVAAVHAAERLPNGLPEHNPATFQIANQFKSSSALLGLFTSLGVGVTCPEVRIGRCRLGDVTIGLEIELAEDFVSEDSFLDAHVGLATVAPMLIPSFSF